MPLTLTATAGSASANSYADVSAATSAAAYRVGGEAAAWLSLSADQKIQTLVTATRAIDTVRFRGSRASTTQALEWPRTGTDYAADQLPTSLVMATIELAWSYASAFATGATDTDVLNPDDSEARIKREKTGPLETEYFAAPAAPQDAYGNVIVGLERFPAIVQRLLAPLVWVASRSAWGSSAVSLSA
jgi:hypothetical protein